MKYAVVGIKGAGKTTLSQRLTDQGVECWDDPKQEDLLKSNVIIKIIRDTNDPKINPPNDYEKIQELLRQQNPDLINKPEIIILNVDETYKGVKNLKISNFDKEIMVCCVKNDHNILKRTVEYANRIV